MRRAAILGVALAIVAGGPAPAETLALSLSTGEVTIGSNFSGTSISLFGVVERDSQTVARVGPYEVIVVARGPEQTVLVQRKERRFGIWVNAAGETFNAMPSYYGVFASPGARRLIEAQDGPAHRLALSMVGGADGTRQRMRAAIARQRRGAGLYVEGFDAVEFLTGTFFRTEIPLPPLVADGDYEVFVLLYAGETPLGTSRLHFKVSKTGFEQRLFELAMNEPLLYGLGAVALALVTGYIGGVVFRRN